MKKQDKALINARRARNIRNVLDNPKDTGIESAQFRYSSHFSPSSSSFFRAVLILVRFWVKKMFQLEPNDHRTLDVREKSDSQVKTVLILFLEQKIHMPRGQTRGNPRKALQDPDPGTSAMPTRRPRQDVSRCTSEIFMVRLAKSLTIVVSRLTMIFFFLKKKGFPKNSSRASSKSAQPVKAAGAQS